MLNNNSIARAITKKGETQTRIMIAVGVAKKTERDTEAMEWSRYNKHRGEGSNSLDLELTEQYVKSSWDWPRRR